MRLTSILTLPGADLREKAMRLRDEGLRRLAHRLPRRLAYWSLIDSGVRAIRGDPSGVSYLDVLKRAGQGLDLR